MIEQPHHGIGFPLELTLSLLCLSLFIAYIAAALTSNRRRHLQTWPPHRYVCCFFGILCAAIALIGPLARVAHAHFPTHMIGHLLLGMLAPLLIVLAAPMTLLLRTLNVSAAKRVSRILKARPLRLFNHPIVTSMLNIGGLWILYTTNLYTAMQHHLLLHLIIHFHVFAAGYLFTASMIYIDPTPHRFSFKYRSIVLIIALAGHAILSKYIYAYPPAGVPRLEAEIGGKLMYYGGDAIDIVIIYILLLHWYKAARPRKIYTYDTTSMIK